MSGNDSEDEKLKGKELYPGGSPPGKTMASESVTPLRTDLRPDNEGGVVVTPSALDMTIPRIEKPKEKDILALFVTQELDRINGQPDYTTLVHARKQSAKNALRVPSKFGGGKTGHVGMVIKPTVFEKRQGQQNGKSQNQRGCSQYSQPE